MSPLEHVVCVAREWVEKAENDLKNAAHTVRMGLECPTDTVCFHAQQCVEKYLKALLVTQGIDFPKTHDVEELMNLTPAAMRPNLSASDEALLTDYATTARYPGYGETISLSDALDAVRIAKRARQAIRRHLRAAGVIR